MQAASQLNRHCNQSLTDCQCSPLSSTTPHRKALLTLRISWTTAIAPACSMSRSWNSVLTGAVAAPSNNCCRSRVRRTASLIKKGTLCCSQARPSLASIWKRYGRVISPIFCRGSRIRRNNAGSTRNLTRLSPSIACGLSRKRS